MDQLFADFCLPQLHAGIHVAFGNIFDVIHSLLLVFALKVRLQSAFNRLPISAVISQPRKDYMNEISSSKGIHQPSLMLYIHRDRRNRQNLILK